MGPALFSLFLHKKLYKLFSIHFFPNEDSKMPEAPLAHLLWDRSRKTRGFALTMSKLERANPQRMREALDAIIHSEVRNAWLTLDKQMSSGANVAVYSTAANPETSVEYFLAGVFRQKLGPDLEFGSPYECMLFRDDQYPQGFYNIFVAAVRVVHPDYEPVSSQMGDIRFKKLEGVTAAAAQPLTL